jgi:rhodanese-related sulfurtransferase
VLLRRTAWQLAALIGLSAVLGFAFNAANPVGVRFKPDVHSAAVMPGVVSNEFKLVSTTNATTNPTPSAATHTVVPHITVPSPPPFLQTNLPSSAVALVINPVVVAVPPAVTVAQTNSNPAPIHWLQAKPLVAAGQAILVDVRPKAGFDAGHIPGAISLPETSSPPEFAAFLQQFPTNLTLIAYCSSTSCSQSLRMATRFVQEFRWASVKFMTGGYQEYQREELAKPQPPNP